MRHTILTGEVDIVAHRSTNALVVVSTRENFQQLQELIEALDVPTLQPRSATETPSSSEM